MEAQLVLRLDRLDELAAAPRLLDVVGAAEDDVEEEEAGDLARADRVMGRRMATVPKCKFDLEICGGTFVDEPCVVDGNLVSGRTFHDNGRYFGKFIELLEGQG